MDYDDLLKEIGQWGPWQKQTILCLWVPAIVTGAAFMTYSFALGTPNQFRCKVPECEDHLERPEFDVPHLWIQNHLPKLDEHIDKHQCQMRTWNEARSYCHNSTLETFSPHQSKFQNCEEFVFDTRDFESTIVTEYGIVCERRHLKSIVGMAMIVMLGVGGYTFGYVSDTFGRKPVIFLTLFACVSFNIASTFSTSFWMYCGLFLAGCLFLNGSYYGPFIMSVELVGKDYAAVCSLAVNFPFVLGEIIPVIVSYFIRDFRQMILVTFIPMYLILPMWFIIPESPRWLLVNEKMDEFVKTIQKAAKTNGTVISDAVIRSTKTHHEENECHQGSYLDDKQVHIWNLLRSRSLLKRIIIVLLNWMAVVLCYNGLTMNSINLGGHVHFNMALGVIIEIPSYLFCIMIINRLGRRPMLVLTQMICAVFCLATLVVPSGRPDLHWIIVTCSTIAKFGTTSAFSIVILQTSELFPTSVRNTVVGACSLTSRFGAMMAPVVANLQPGHEYVPMLVFGLVSFIAGITGIFLPETHGKALPVTIRDAEEEDDSPSIFFCFKCCQVKQPEPIPV